MARNFIISDLPRDRCAGNPEDIAVTQGEMPMDRVIGSIARCSAR
jgi:hypothetical protein